MTNTLKVRCQCASCLNELLQHGRGHDEDNQVKNKTNHKENLNFHFLTHVQINHLTLSNNFQSFSIQKVFWVQGSDQDFQPVALPEDQQGVSDACAKVSKLDNYVGLGLGLGLGLTKCL